MASALVGLGSNVGDRRATLKRAVELLDALDGVRVVRVSRWIVTEPIGQSEGAEKFLNGAALLETTLSPEALLAQLHTIELQLGRRRAKRWAPRMIDLDLLLHEEQIVHAGQLQLPHPRMSFRRFVLAPAAEIAGTLVHPEIGLSIQQLLSHLDSALPYIAISGARPAENRRLAATVCAKTGWKLLDFPAADVLFEPADSTSLTLTQAIEFLRCAAALVTHNHLASAGCAISSFWIEAMLAAARARWPGQFEALWTNMRPAIAAPKLLVELAGPARTQIAGCGAGPTLRLDAADLAGAETEVLAAIDAMK